MCIHVLVQRNHLFCKTNTQKMVAKVNNLRTEEKLSFVYLRIRASGQRNHSLTLPSCPLTVPPSCCTSWLFHGLHQKLLLPSNVTATSLYCTLQPPPLLPLPLPLPLGCHRHHRRHRHHHCQTPIVHCQKCTNVKMFTSPDNLDLFNLSTVFEVCDVGQENFAISKLFA